MVNNLLGKRRYLWAIVVSTVAHEAILNRIFVYFSTWKSQYGQCLLNTIYKSHDFNNNISIFSISLRSLSRSFFTTTIVVAQLINLISIIQRLVRDCVCNSTKFITAAKRTELLLLMHTHTQRERYISITHIYIYACVMCMHADGKMQK